LDQQATWNSQVSKLWSTYNLDHEYILKLFAWTDYDPKGVDEFLRWFVPTIIGLALTGLCLESGKRITKLLLEGTECRQKLAPLAITVFYTIFAVYVFGLTAVSKTILFNLLRNFFQTINLKIGSRVFFLQNKMTLFLTSL